MRVEISNGELIDKITILMIKLEKIKDKKKLNNITVELDTLLRTGILDSDDKGLRELFTQLTSANETLWDIENQIREKESKQVFDEEFINLARSVYKTNDLRASLKAKINKITQSKMMEEKEYTKYE